MSESKANAMLESFSTKLDIQMVSPRIYDWMIERARLTPRSIICAIGPSGVGKSAIPRQIAKRRKAPYLPLFLPQMPIQDWHIPTFANDTKQYFDKRIPRRFQPVFEYIDKLHDKYGATIPDGHQPIIAVEELNRARDKHVTQAAFTLLEDRMIGDTCVDEYIQIICTMNPSGSAFAVNEFERDPACRRRLSMVGVAPSYGDFIRYANESKWHEKVIKFLEAQPTAFYDYEASLTGKQFPCPASWETVSQILMALDSDHVDLGDPGVSSLLAGKIGDTVTTAFMEFAQDNMIIITPDEVLKDYAEKSDVRKRFLDDYIAKGDFPKIDELMMGVAIKTLSDTKRDLRKVGKQLALFMEDLPEEKLKLFVRNLVEQGKISDEAHKYLLKFNGMLNSEPYFLNAAKKLTAAEAKVAEEKAKSNFTP